jgi:hypothetical protein
MLDKNEIFHGIWLGNMFKRKKQPIVCINQKYLQSFLSLFLILNTKKEKENFANIFR